MKSEIMMNTKSQPSTMAEKINGTRKTCGVEPINYAVHFIILIPILMFLQLQRMQRSKKPQIPQTT